MIEAKKIGEAEMVEPLSGESESAIELFHRVRGILYPELGAVNLGTIPYSAEETIVHLEELREAGVVKYWQGINSETVIFVLLENGSNEPDETFYDEEYDSKAQLILAILCREDSREYNRELFTLVSQNEAIALMIFLDNSRGRNRLFKEHTNSDDAGSVPSKVYEYVEETVSEIKSRLSNSDIPLFKMPKPRTDYFTLPIPAEAIKFRGWVLEETENRFGITPEAIKKAKFDEFVESFVNSGSCYVIFADLLALGIEPSKKNIEELANLLKKEEYNGRYFLKLGYGFGEVTKYDILKYTARRLVELEYVGEESTYSFRNIKVTAFKEVEGNANGSKADTDNFWYSNTYVLAKIENTVRETSIFTLLSKTEFGLLAELLENNGRVHTSEYLHINFSEVAKSIERKIGYKLVSSEKRNGYWSIQC